MGHLITFAPLKGALSLELASDAACVQGTNTTSLQRNLFIFLAGNPQVDISTFVVFR